MPNIPRIENIARIDPSIFDVIGRIPINPTFPRVPIDIGPIGPIGPRLPDDIRLPPRFPGSTGITRPKPGDLITSALVGQLIDALEAHGAAIEELRRRLAVLEAGGGRKGPEVVAVDPGRFKDFIGKLRDDEKVLQVTDKADRLEKAAQVYLQDRDTLLLDDELKASKELTEEEWVMIGTAAGIKPSDVPGVLANTRPVAARGIVTKLGDVVGDLDAYANLSRGTIGLT